MKPSMTEKVKKYMDHKYLKKEHGNINISGPEIQNVTFFAPIPIFNICSVQQKKNYITYSSSPPKESNLEKIVLI